MQAVFTIAYDVDSWLGKKDADGIEYALQQMLQKKALLVLVTGKVPAKSIMHD